MFDFLNLPKNTIAGKTITKNIFELAEISNSDKKLLSSDVDVIIWENRIAQDNVNIRPLCNDEIDYSEIQVINVRLKKTNHVPKIAKLIFSSFTYPLILIFTFELELKIMLAHVRINQNDHSKLVVGDIIQSRWLQCDSSELSVFDIKKMSITNLYELYSGYVNVLLRFKVESEIGVKAELSSEEYHEILQRIDGIDSKITELRSQLKKEDQFNRQMDLNNEIKQLQKEREQFVAKISEKGDI